MRNSIAIIAAILLSGCGRTADRANSGAVSAGSATNTLAVINADFEQAEVDGGIPGWTIIQHAGPPSYEMAIDGAGAYAGHGSARLTRTREQVYGTLVQDIVAKPFAGETVELSAMVKTRDVGAQGWALIITTPNYGVRELSPKVTGTSDWQRLSVRAHLPPGTISIKIGAILLDGGSGWMDDVQLRTIAR